MPGMRPKGSYVVYIDEAGDPGIRQKSAEQLTAASEWFVVAAVVVRRERERDTVDWLRDMREAVRAQARAPIHFRSLSASNRERVCRMLGTKDVRLFIVASHKTNMRGHQNRRIGSRLGRGEFYNWCLRLLLERVSLWCAHRSQKERGCIEPAELVFSERGGHDYSHLRAYLANLDLQAREGKTFLKTKEIVPGIIDGALVKVQPHASLAGLQLADIAASAFFQATDSTLSSHTLACASALGGRVAKAPGARAAAEFGLLRLPFGHQGDIPIADRPLFELFGYRWR